MALNFDNYLVRDEVDQSLILHLVDANGDPVTTADHNTAGLSIQYLIPGAAAVVTVTPASLAAIDTAHADGGIKHLFKGLYRFDLPDAAAVGTPRGILFGVSSTSLFKTRPLWVPVFDTAPTDAALTLAQIFQQIEAGDLTTITAPADKSNIRWKQQGGLPLTDLDINPSTGVWSAKDFDGTTEVASGTITSPSDLPITEVEAD